MARNFLELLARVCVGRVKKLDCSSGSMHLLTKNHGVWLPPFASALSEPKSAVPSTSRKDLCPSVVPHDKSLQKHLPDAPRIVWLWSPRSLSVQSSGLWRRIIKAHINNLEGLQREVGKLRHILETIFIRNWLPLLQSMTRSDFAFIYAIIWYLSIMLVW